MKNDLVTLRVGHTFFFAPLNRWLHNGATITISRDQYPRYSRWCNEVVSGSIAAPEPAQQTPVRRSFVERIVEKVGTLDMAGKKEKAGKAVKAPDSSKDGKFPCPECGVVFTALRGMELHLQRTHLPAEPE